MKFRVPLFILFLSMLSCKTEEDQHPEVPFYCSDMYSDSFTVEYLDFIEKFITDTNDYVYTIFFKGYGEYFEGYAKDIIVRDKFDYKIIHKSSVIGKKYSIASTGSIYVLENDTCYKLTPPCFNKTVISPMSLEDLKANKIEEDHRGEINFERLKNESSEEYFGYIRKKRNKLLEEKILNNYEYLYRDLFFDVIRYQNGKEFYFKERTFLNTSLKEYPNELTIVSENKSVSKKEDFYSTIDYSIEEFDDHSLLESKFVWNNYGRLGSLIPNYYSKELYYYNLQIGDESYKFKTGSPLYKVVSFNNEILFSGGSGTYKIELIL